MCRVSMKRLKNVRPHVHFSTVDALISCCNTLTVSICSPHCAILISESHSGTVLLPCRRQGDPLLFIWTLWLRLLRCDWSGTSGEKAPDKWAWLDSANQRSTLVWKRQVEWAEFPPSYLPITWVKIVQETPQIYCCLLNLKSSFPSWLSQNIFSLLSVLMPFYSCCLIYLY